MPSKWYVGVDIGGTTIKLGFVTAKGDIIRKWEIPTNTKNGGDSLTTDIHASIKDQLAQLSVSYDQLEAIGVGAPGFIDMQTGVVHEAVNIGWYDFPLKKNLEQKTGLRVVVDNDANMAALGEMWQGAGKGAKELICVTLGTGVGGGVITNGRIVHGANGMAGEIGHYTIIPERGAPCNCGKSGCLETVASATGITRLAVERMNQFPTSYVKDLFNKQGHLTSKDVFDGVMKRDALALSVLADVSSYLGLALANVAVALNPEIIVIGGGVSKAGELLLEPIKEKFNQFALKRIANATSIKIASLGNSAGVIGGAWLAKT